ncbi:TIGR03571 family LLM class oxidoreductase [Paenalcaligenes niemegkensis]|uniref:TIGR03571 family LLM class oxidoreductase n=1 Tax=Paenalcaligenes niemegkensis TaxID=2895469 RepID=UPI001EE8A03D|nr:TIGR03571 family LLM class oxidoreductase [Paenalcaligenes niemegkensis]MCQ9617080.1 TIGR03571 family LLM class oxidoreductase [Paenalcaligenes niemegkensis]
MSGFNAAYAKTFRSGRLTLGLMTPFAQLRGQMAHPDEALELAALADDLNFAALWARDVPLMIPQGHDNMVSALDDPFLWLAGLAGATQRIAMGAAAIVLPLRHPLHVAKAALTLDRLSSGRFILGLGSGDRPEEFDPFGADLESRKEAFSNGWSLLRAALSPMVEERASLLEATGGYELMAIPEFRIPMMAVGSARQSIQWIAEHADAWATYHRLEERQQGRIRMWQQALEQRAEGSPKPFVQSLQLDLLQDPVAAAEPINLGLRCGRNALLDYLRRLEALGVGHVLINLARNERPVRDVIQELGEEVLPLL